MEIFSNASESQNIMFEYPKRETNKTLKYEIEINEIKKQTNGYCAVIKVDVNNDQN